MLDNDTRGWIMAVVSGIGMFTHGSAGRLSLTEAQRVHLARR